MATTTTSTRTPPADDQQLLSNDPREIAVYLTDLFLDQLANFQMPASSQSPGEPYQGELVGILRELRDTMWTAKGGIPATEEGKLTVFNNARAQVDGLSDDPVIRADLHSLLIEHFARMGHFYEMSGLIARDNFSLDKDMGGPLSFVEKMTAEHKDLDQMIEALNEPVFEITMTAHPTNVNAPGAIRQLGKIGSDVEALRSRMIREPGGATGPLKTALYNSILQFWNDPATSLVKRNDKGEMENLTVRDETDLAIYYLNNAYDYLPDTYAKFDQALTGVSSEYKPETLDMRIRFNSWASAGDKDGNQNVFAQGTLEAIGRHRLAILQRYNRDMSTSNLPYAELDPWREAFGRLELVMATEVNKLETTLKDKKFLTDEEFNEFSKSIQINEPKIEDFIKTVEELYQAENGQDEAGAQHKQDLLNLLRRARTFRLALAPVEYRETAEQHTLALSVILGGAEFNNTPGDPNNNIDDFDKLTPEAKKQVEAARVKRLTDIIQNPGEAARLLNRPSDEPGKTVRDVIIVRGQGKPYRDADGNTDPYVIAYQTLCRMELARDHPDMILNNVLAECRQPSNVLEAVFFQHAVTDGQGKRPYLGVIPLFEDPDSMKNIGGIMREIYTNPAYDAHLQTLADLRHNGEKTQQVQLAHSDNSRRAGMPAARAFIYEGHAILRRLGEELGIKTQFYEGGSQSDLFRGGVRAVSAVINSFGLHHFAKFTFQGGDLMNLFNFGPSFIRMITRNISHCAKHLEQDYAVKDVFGTTVQYRVLNGKNGNGYANGNGNGNGHAAKLNGSKNGHDPVLNNRTLFNVGSSDHDFIYNAIATKALEDTYPDYKKLRWENPNFGKFYTLIGFDSEKEPGNGGSRGVLRAVDSGGETGDKRPMKGAPLESVRTITFSEIPQHKRFVPTHLGMKHFDNRLRDSMAAFCKNYEDPEKMAKVSAEDRPHYDRAYSEIKPLTAEMRTPPSAYKTFYNRSGVFRDVVDRVAMGVTNSDTDRLDKIVDAEKKKYQFKGQAPHIKGPELASLEHFVDDIKAEYRRAGRIAYESLTGKPMLLQSPSIRGEDDKARNRRVRRGVMAALPHLADTISDKMNFMDFIDTTQDSWKDVPLRLLHLCRDMVTHGRYLEGEDPIYGQQRYAEKQQLLATTPTRA